MATVNSLTTEEVEKFLCTFCYKPVLHYDLKTSNKNGEDGPRSPNTS